MKKIIPLVLTLLLVLPILVFAQAGPKFLKSGDRGLEIKDLQEILKEDPTIYPEGLTTGYFGSLTKKAIERLQEKSGLPQTGILDEKTAQVIFPCTDVKITILVPNGGENWDRKDVHEIKWKLSKTEEAVSFSPSEIESRFFWPRGRIDLIKSDGTLVKHISSVNLAHQNYNWPISSDIPNGSDYKIRISYWWIRPCPKPGPCPRPLIDELYPQCSNLEDESDGTFTVSGEIPPSSDKIQEAIQILQQVISRLNQLLTILQSL